jgi:hypothetical protein
MDSGIERQMAALVALDERLLAAVAGQEREVAEWMARRQTLIGTIASACTNLEDLSELDARTRRLEDRFLHWRRTSIMELSEIERHLRYANDQRPELNPSSTRVTLSA